MMKPFTGPDGTVYNFDHMKSVHDSVSVTVNGKRYLIPLIVIFSSHCYSDCRNGTVRMDDELYLLTDDSGHRAFCLERYNASKYLPDRVLTMLGQNAACYKLDKAAGYIYIHDPRFPDKWRGWYVFFKFNKSKTGAPLSLHINVTSHHYRNSAPPNLRWKGSFKFPAVVAEWLRTRADFLGLFTPLDAEGQDQAGTEAQPELEKEKPA